MTPRKAGCRERSAAAAAAAATLAAIVLLGGVIDTAHAGHCAAYDSDGNAYIFSRDFGDYSLGTNVTDPASWTSLTGKQGRPDFSGNSTQCFTNQFTDGLYVLGGDAANPDDAYIFNFQSQSWSTQQTTGGPGGDFVAILDHDTTALYAFANGTMYSLQFDQSAAKATSSPIQWQSGAAANAVPFPTDNYQPVLGAANNHIQFLNVPGSQPGQAYIFVIHFAHFQPEVQSFGDFPVSHGQTVTILSNSSSAPNTFAFVPDSGNGTYIINAKSNTTRSLSGPPFADASASYAASTDALIQLTSNGTLSRTSLFADSWTTTIVPASNSSASNSSSSSNNSTRSGIRGAGGQSGSKSLTSSGPSPTNASGASLSLSVIRELLLATVTTAVVAALLVL